MLLRLVSFTILLISRIVFLAYINSDFSTSSSSISASLNPRSSDLNRGISQVDSFLLFISYNAATHCLFLWNYDFAADWNISVSLHKGLRDLMSDWDYFLKGDTAALRVSVGVLI